MKEENKNISRRRSASSKKTQAKKPEKKVWKTLKKIWHYVWMFRGVIISLPVLICAIIQAFRNASNLPETVGLNLQATGDFAKTWNRPVAVLVPLLVTFGCILLTCFSKRPLFPWLVSIFTLVIPMLIWFINVYPA